MLEILLGFKDGIIVSIILGILLGYWIGFNDGMLLGLYVGTKVGGMLCDCDGIAVGSGVGNTSKVQNCAKISENISFLTPFLLYFFQNYCLIIFKKFPFFEIFCFQNKNKNKNKKTKKSKQTKKTKK